MARTFQDLLVDSDTWRGLLSRPESWLVIGSNSLPLIGIFFLGWDASTLLILYWLETAVVGFWLFLRLVLTNEPRGTALFGIGINGERVPLALFLLAHGGVFMFGHMFFLGNLARGEWSNHMGSIADFLFGFVIPSGLWIPLAGLFAVRGGITFREILSGNSPGHLIAGFYARIFLMQFVIVFGAMIALMLNSPLPLLVMVVAFKIMAELLWDRLITPLAASFS